MRQFSDLTETQQDAVDYLFENDTTMLYATMGFGKTVVAYTAVSELLSEKAIKRVLVVAPLRPARDVWMTEVEKWAHLEHLTVASAMGTETKRMAGLCADADITVINTENLVWMFDYLKGLGDLHRFDALIVDELSKFKDSGTKLVKCLRHRTRDFEWICGLTGTPVHESLEGLFAQALVLDGGKSYGRNKLKFLETYFYPTDYEQRNWEIQIGMEASLIDKIKWMVYAAPDYTAELPPVHEEPVFFSLSDSAMDKYRFLQKNFVLPDPEVICANAAVLSGKLEQLSAGFLYSNDELQIGVPVCDSRVNALGDLLDKVMLDGERVIICYWFKHNLAEIQALLDEDGIRHATITDFDAVGQWNRKELGVLLLNPRSAGHGLNLAEGGHTMIWYTPCWSNDLWKQTVARIWRRGQDHQVTSYSLIANDTVNELMLARVESKEEYDKVFREHLEG